MLIRPDKLLAAVAARVVGFAGHAGTLPSYRPLARSVSMISIMNRIAVPIITIIIIMFPSSSSVIIKKGNFSVSKP